LERIAMLDLTDSLFAALVGGITGGDISADGRRVALCDYMRAYEAVLPAGASFDTIWRQQFVTLKLGPGEQREAICFRPRDNALIFTAEGRPCNVGIISP
jgi:hypothetical protein